MKVVYLIIAHTNAGQVARLAGAILGASPAGEVIVLNAAAAAPPDLGPWAASGRAQVLPYQRQVYWGDYSLVAKVLHGLRLAVARGLDWLVLLSGQDYPLRPLAGLEAELAATGYDAFIAGTRIEGGGPCHPVACGLVRRPAPACRRCQELYLYRYWRLPLGRQGRRAVDWLNRRAPEGLPLLRYQRLRQEGSRGGTLLGVRAGRPPFSASFPCYKGALWLTASRAALTELLRAVDGSPGLVRYYRRTILPDESLFVTLLKNTRGLKVGADTQRYVNWPDARSASPAILRAADFERLVATGAYFGRKFDSRVDAAILDRLDAHCAPRPAVTG